MIDEDSRKLISLLPPPVDFQLVIADIKVLGKRELSILLKYRHKLKIIVNKQKLDVLTEEKKKMKDEEKDKDYDGDEENIEKDLEEMIARRDKLMKKSVKKIRDKSARTQQKIADSAFSGNIQDV